MRKNFKRFFVYVNQGSYRIIKHSFFETITLIVIVVNSIFLAIDNGSQDMADLLASADNIFLALYSAEMLLKIFGTGLIMHHDSYLRDPWNVMDFFIVLSGFASILLVVITSSSGTVNLSVLRSFRVLRPLRTISGIEGLRILVITLVAAMPPLLNTIIVLLFFFLIFAIGGQQMFSGELLKRCIRIETGTMHASNLLCGGSASCPSGYFCGKTLKNPN